MSFPSIEELKEATTELLKKAYAEGQLSKLTVRTVRERLEERLQLAPGSLDAKEYKAPIKKTVVRYLEKGSNSRNEADEEESQPKPEQKPKVNVDEDIVKPRKSASKPKESSKGTKAKRATKSSSTKVESEASEISEDEASAKARRVKPLKKKAFVEPQSEGDDDKDETKPSASKRSRKASETKNSTSGTAAKPYKSASTVESSGDEAHHKCPSKPVVSSSKKEMQSPPSKEKPFSKHEDMDESQPGLSPTSRSQEPGMAANHPPPRSNSHGNEHESDSHVSMVVDEPPKKRKRKQDKDSKNSKKDPKEQKKTRKSDAAGTSKDDEFVSKLKAMVVACGVRKVWKKEFADLDTPSGQIKRLKEILKDLGMSGRLSLEKAKTIRTQREFAQELKDVQEFAEASRRREMKKEQGTSEDEHSGSESDDEDESPPVKRKRTAGASILAFLQDQSDEE